MNARLALLTLLAGCSLFTRSQPVEVRYFSPERPSDKVPAQEARSEPATGERDERARVRLGRVAPSMHLREEIVRRESPVELDLYQTRLWTEPPDAYVRRALERALFDDRPLEEAVSGRALTLHVDVTGFEETLDPRRAGRVQLHYRLQDEQRVVDSGVVTVERPVQGGDFSAVVAAIGEALDEATGRVADIVAREVAARQET